MQGAFYSNITLADDGVNRPTMRCELSTQHRFSHGFTLLSVFTWSHCMTGAETYGNRNSLGSTQYQDPYDRNLDHVPRDTDLQHNFNNSLVYETPEIPPTVLPKQLSDIGRSAGWRRCIRDSHSTP